MSHESLPILALEHSPFALVEVCKDSPSLKRPRAAYAPGSAAISYNSQFCQNVEGILYDASLWHVLGHQAFMDVSP